MSSKEQLITSVKRNRTIYLVYFYVMSFILKLVKLFIRPDDKLILFVSYGGRYFNDSPRTLYEAMKKDERFVDYKMVWAFRKPSDFHEVKDKIAIDGLKYFVTALKARCWITNVHIERGLDFKGKNTFYFNTTHTLLPKVNSLLINKEETFTTKAKSKCDCYSVQCEYEREIMGNKDKVVIIGYPKSDILVNYTEEYKNSIKRNLNLPIDKIIVLYAPTFREGTLSENPIPINFSRWKDVLGSDYYVLFRAHPVYASKIESSLEFDFVKDVSSYPNNSDLLIASDILISDYSGIFFEFGVQDKPMFCYAYDYEEYIRIRPLYFDIRDELPGGHLNEEELLSYIKNGDQREIMDKVYQFKSKYIQAYGNATVKSMDIIYNNIHRIH